MSLSTIQIAQQLSPMELEYVTEHALASGPFTVEEIIWDGGEAAKLVTVKFRSERKKTIEVPTWLISHKRLS